LRRDAKAMTGPRLVVVPIYAEMDSAQVIGAVRLLMRERSLGVRNSVFVTWDEEGALCIADALDSRTDDAPAGAMWWRFVLEALFGCPVVESDTTTPATDPCGSALDEKELSTSFVRELRETVARGTPFVAVIVDPLGPGAIVHEASRIPMLRVIYGVLPNSWLRGAPWPSGGESPLRGDAALPSQR
jgi:uncharacterized membrane protein